MFLTECTVGRYCSFKRMLGYIKETDVKNKKIVFSTTRGLEIVVSLDENIVTRDVKQYYNSSLCYPSIFEINLIGQEFITEAWMSSSENTANIPLNIYILTRNCKEDDYSAIQSFFVTAENEEEARNTYPDNSKCSTEYNNYAVSWADSKNITVMYVGKATPGIPKCVIGVIPVGD
jgi:hypothetical protein